MLNKKKFGVGHHLAASRYNQQSIPDDMQWMSKKKKKGGLKEYRYVPRCEMVMTFTFTWAGNYFPTTFSFPADVFLWFQQNDQWQLRKLGLLGNLKTILIYPISMHDPFNILFVV